jgi:hypothetical protein
MPGNVAERGILSEWNSSAIQGHGWDLYDTAQMLAHCSVSMQWAVGEVVPEKGALPVRLMGRLVKPMVFRNDDPLRKNSPTAKSLIVADERDFG